MGYLTINRASAKAERRCAYRGGVQNQVIRSI
jgi:hypothetical protein